MSGDPELEEATTEATAKLQRIQTSIRDSLDLAYGARESLSEASTRARQAARVAESSSSGGGGSGGGRSHSKAGQAKQKDADRRQMQLDQVSKSLEKLNRDLGSGDAEWSAQDWLQSLRHATGAISADGTKEEVSVLGVLAGVLQARKPSDLSVFEYIKSIDDVEGVLLSGELVRSLSAVVSGGVSELKRQKAASAQQLSDKFKNDDGAFTFSYGGLSTFFGGLEGLVGTPNANLYEYMERDHCEQLDSLEWFAVRNSGGVEFMGPKITEWGKEYALSPPPHCHPP